VRKHLEYLGGRYAQQKDAELSRIFMTKGGRGTKNMRSSHTKDI